VKTGTRVYTVERRSGDGEVVNEMEVLLRTEWGGKKMIGTITGIHPLMKQMVMVQWPNEEKPTPAFVDELRALSAIDLLGALVDDEATG
jgi:hypothetical protein